MQGPTSKGLLDAMLGFLARGTWQKEELRRGSPKSVAIILTCLLSVVCGLVLWAANGEKPAIFRQLHAKYTILTARNKAHGDIQSAHEVPGTHGET